ncbi:hypothetical protein [Xylocopilactobacillus apis]|uniref:DUF4352 domain-containing protein n=1 Tax=Xylocopilactobacillus apis TaxID=2932183 RepID=A0AAU9D2J5_9LACO|nr:hypothetical protein [Xylocopilactobacillus apis]BDR55615.1 hypothetical protein KIMC2_01770 [Xylocopilactobacillus apis]
MNKKNILEYIKHNFIKLSFFLVIAVIVFVFGLGFTQRSRVNAYNDLKITSLTTHKPLSANGLTISVLKRKVDRKKEIITYELKVDAPKDTAFPTFNFYVADFNMSAGCNSSVNMFSEAKINGKLIKNVPKGTSIVTISAEIWPETKSKDFNLVFSRYESTKRRYAVYVLD